jgi:hypothetical protein
MTIHPTTDDPMIRIDNRLVLCHHCDGGLPAACTCPGVDEYREDVTYLLGVIQSLVERDLKQAEA